VLLPIYALTALTLFATPVAAGGWDDGVEAYEAGNYQKAFRIWKPLAEQGDAEAQYSLGSMYYNGEGVKQSHIDAYAWWSITATRGNEKAKKNKGIVKKQMTPAQIAKGQELAVEYWEKYVVPFQKD
jgi:TPR repeat protein